MIKKYLRPRPPIKLKVTGDIHIAEITDITNEPSHRIALDIVREFIDLYNLHGVISPVAKLYLEGYIARELRRVKRAARRTAAEECAKIFTDQQDTHESLWNSPSSLLEEIIRLIEVHFNLQQNTEEVEGND